VSLKRKINFNSRVGATKLNSGTLSFESNCRYTKVSVSKDAQHYVFVLLRNRGGLYLHVQIVENIDLPCLRIPPQVNNLYLLNTNTLLLTVIADSGKKKFSRSDSQILQIRILLLIHIFANIPTSNLTQFCFTMLIYVQSKKAIRIFICLE
jgi:hypothetical protein